MSNDVPIELTEEFDTAFAELASARASYEDQPRRPDLIAALGAARLRLEEARRAIDEERRRLGLESPWRIQPGEVATTKAPPIWSVNHSPGS